MATVTLFITTGLTGQSSLVGTLEMATMTLKDASSAALPNTGCFDSPEKRGTSEKCHMRACVTLQDQRCHDITKRLSQP